jgi:hypothetical protein
MMKTKSIIIILLATVMILSAGVQAATVTFHTTAPTPSPYDIYNFVGAARDLNNVGTATADGAFNDATTYVAMDRGAMGQTFKTGTSKPVYLLTGIWVRHVGYTNENTVSTWYAMPNNGRIGIRVTDPCASGTAGFVLGSETYTVTGSEPNKLPAATTNNVTGTGTWIHVVLDEPVAVGPNRTYGFDMVGVAGTGLFFETHGIKNTATNGNPYTAGTAYTSGLNGAAGSTLTVAPGDRVFVVELVGAPPPTASVPSPADKATGVSQDPVLSWSAGFDSTKSKVFFGTSPGSLVLQTTITHTTGVERYSYQKTGLATLQSYYWRVDEVPSTGPDVMGDVWSFTTGTPKASNPNPYDNEICVSISPDTILSWKAGLKSAQSKVYFGTSPGSLVLQTTITHTTGVERYSYVKTGLVNNQDYYWQIDEVNGASISTGDVWHFKTIPIIPVTNPNLVGWWKFDEGPGKAIDWSGLNQHGTAYGNPASVAGYIGYAMGFDGIDDRVSLPIGATISTLDSATIATWVNFSGGAAWQRIFDFGNDPGTGVPTVYMCLIPSNAGGVPQFSITTTGGGGASNVTAPSALPSGWHHIAVTLNGGTNQMALYVDAMPVGTAITTTLPSALGDTNDNWLGKSKFWDPPDPYFTGSLDDFRIYNYAMSQSDIGKIMAPPEAWLPNPADGATDVAPTPTLSWRKGVKATKHDVYFSSSFDDVNTATTSSPATIYKGRIDPNKYNITTELKWGQTYYWRIDEVNDPNIWPGSVWSFTVRNFLTVDNFESYTNSDPNIIYKIWEDGVGYSPGNGTGSQVGYRDPNYAEVSIVHGGAQSMPVDYNNTKTPYYSEATRTYATPQNWTVSGSNTLKALSLWFRGYPVSVGSFAETPPGSGTYTITASGADIWDVPDLRHPSRFHDEFHYAYKEVTAAAYDEEEMTDLVKIVARVDSITNTNAWAKAAVMIRDSLDPNSAHGIMCISSTSGAAFQYRDTTGGASASTATGGITAPYWVKLILDTYYTPYVLRAYYSSDGINWTPMGVSQQITNMTLPVYVGLAVTAHNASATCTAVFSNVTMIGTGAEGAWKHQDIGIKSNIASPLYVKLQDSNLNTAKVTYTDANAVLNSAWQAWDIALSDFTGVDPTKIKKMTIGVGSGSADGTGTIYVDDIRLYVPRCVPELLRSAADFTGTDCTVDYQDLAILTDNWAISNWLVTPVNPGTTNLAAYYAFEGNFNDTSGGYNGEPNGATTVADAIRGGQVANFDGSNDYVVLTNLGSLISSMSSTTIATWVNFSNTGGDWQRIFDFGTGTIVYMFLSPRIGAAGVMRFAITTSSNGGESLIDAPSTLATGWHHVAIVIDGVSRTMQLYLDGNALVYGGAPTQTLPSDLGNTTNNWLGRSQWAADGYLSGRLDDFRIYSRALSQGEVAYLAGKTTPFNQALYLLLRPADPAINLYNDGTIDLRDYAAFADEWLEKLLWP